MRARNLRKMGGSLLLASLTMASAGGTAWAQSEKGAASFAPSPPTPPTADIPASRYHDDDTYRRGPSGDQRRETLLTCESRSYSYRRCATDGRIAGLRLVGERSARPCMLGRDWGVEPNGVWVDNGCRATFAIALRHGYDDDDHHDDDAYDLPRVSCASDKLRYRECQIDGRFRNVRIVERLSDASCYPGHDWGVTAYGVWVSNGCRATFSYERGRGGYGYGRATDLVPSGS